MLAPWLTGGVLPCRVFALRRGWQAFFLYDTMGFPLDLTQRMAEESGLTVDTVGYTAAMDAARKLSQVHYCCWLSSGAAHVSHSRRPYTVGAR